MQQLNSLFKKCWDYPFDIFYETKIVRKTWLLLLYVTLFCIGLITTMALSESVFGQSLIHPTDSESIVIGITTIMLTLFVPIAILLIEDAKQSPLQRQIIAKYIIRFDLTIIIVALMALSLLVPKGLVIAGSFTFKSISGVILVLCWIYLFQIFNNAYRWIVDGSDSTTGYGSKPQDNEPVPEAFKSYRFSQTLKYLSNSNSHDAWFNLWKRWYPPAYENSLHEAMFTRQSRILQSKQLNKYPMLANELTAYDKYMFIGRQRSVQDWRYGRQYLKGFLLLHRMYADERQRLSPLFQKKKTGVESYGAISQANNVIGKITREYIKQNLEKENCWEVSNIIAEHARHLNVGRNSSGHLIQDTMLSYFIELAYDKLWDESLDLVDFEDLQSAFPEWIANSGTLKSRDNIVTDSLVRILHNWIGKKFEQSDVQHRDGISNVIGFVYRNADVNVIIEVYWFMYLTGRIADTNAAIYRYVQEHKFFYVVTLNEVDETTTRNSLELLGMLYKNFFTRMHTMDDLLSNAKTILPNLAQQEKIQLNIMIEILTELKRYYDTDQS